MPGVDRRVAHAGVSNAITFLKERKPDDNEPACRDDDRARRLRSNDERSCFDHVVLNPTIDDHDDS